MNIRTRPLLLAAVLLAGALVPLAAPAAADTGPVPLDTTSFARVVADEQRGHLFLSPGRSGSGVVVTDLAGGRVTTIDGLPAATGMALTPDGRSLWVALPGLGALKRIDTTTLGVTQTISLPTGQCPGDVVVVGDRLVYGHSCHQYGPSGGSYGGLGVVDAVTGASYGGVTDGPFYEPVLATGPSGQVYAADAGLSPATLYLYDVSGAAPALVASKRSACENLRDLSARPDGAQVVTACGYPYQHSVWSAPTLEPAGSYPSGAYPLAGAWSADGRTFVSGLDSAYEPDVVFHRVGEDAPVRWVDFGATTELLQPRGLAASADGQRAWAVTMTSSGLALRVLELPSPDAAQLTVSAAPDAVYAGAGVTVSGRLATAAGEPLPGEVLQLTRGATGETPVRLQDVTTDEWGTFELVDVPPGEGTYVYSVSRASDGARAEVAVLVWTTEGTLLLDVSRGTSGGTPVDGTVALSYDGPDSPAGLTVRLVRAAGGLQTVLPSLTTDAKGRASFTDSPPAGEVTYTVSVAANGVHPEVTATRTTTVLTATTLTATAPSTAAAGAPLRVSGVLSAPAGPVPGASVAVVRSGCGAGWSSSAVTTPNGSWSVTDPTPQVGTCTYSASYAGGDGYASSGATASSTVSLTASSLTATTPSSAEAGSPVTVRGALSSAGAALAGAPVQVVRAGCSSGDWSGTAVTAADGAWSVEDPGPPAGTCTYRATYAGDTTHAAADASASTTVLLRTTSLGLSVVRGTGSTKKLAYVTGQLGAWHTNRTLTITAQPRGGAEVVLAVASVDASGKLTATYSPKTTTTYRVKYAGDDWYGAATAERTQ